MTSEGAYGVDFSQNNSSSLSTADRFQINKPLYSSIYALTVMHKLSASRTVGQNCVKQLIVGLYRSR